MAGPFEDALAGAEAGVAAAGGGGSDFEHAAAETSRITAKALQFMRILLFG